MISQIPDRMLRYPWRVHWRRFLLLPHRLDDGRWAWREWVWVRRTDRGRVFSIERPYTPDYERRWIIDLLWNFLEPQ